METVSLKELRRSLGRLIRSRKPVVLTRRGKPVARLLPMERQPTIGDALSLVDRLAGSITDPLLPRDGSTHLDDYIYGPERPAR
ncbi:MAG: type II toxin-antitoxin system Phd/YefM family antitoxin [Planctomycetes bacterium]|nr:type II toxin-antitoxin system Phd/YefM family antitoxin [Planctomycetota bacterium]